MERLYIAAEIAAMTGLSKHIINACLLSGQIKHIQPSRRKYVYESDLLVWANKEGIVVHWGKDGPQEEAVKNALVKTGKEAI